jgi:hypothetical protein
LIRTQTSALAAVLTLLFAGAALAEGQRVEVQVEVVHASDKGSAIEPPSLKHMQEAFSQSGFNYKSYRRLSDERLTLEANQPKKVSLPNGRTATLSLVEVKDNVAQIHVSLPPLETTYTLGREASVFLQGGAHNGGMLVLVLSPVKK